MMSNSFKEENLNEDIPDLDFIKEEEYSLDDVIKQELEAETENVFNFDDKPYKCEHCPKAFQTLRNLNIHKSIQHGKSSKVNGHSDERSYMCDQCDKTFKTKPKFIIHHKYVHATERPFQCPKCPKSFAMGSFLNGHLKTHVKERPYPCDVCSKTYKTPKAVTIHKAMVHNLGGKFGCEKCGKRFMAPSLYEDHMAGHKGEKNFRCGQCDTAFKTRHSLNTHRTYAHATDKPFQCEVCSKRFVHASLLKFHFQKHIPKLSHQCDQCSEAFVKSKSLAWHKVQVHNVGGEFCCEKCGKVFISAIRFKKHELWHNEGKIFDCNLCDKSFNDKYDLYIHRKSTHATGKASFQCEVCLESFPNVSAVKCHSAKHSEERPHKCDRCPKAFKTRGSLNKHKMDDHNVGGKFSCGHCGRSFNNPFKFEEHLACGTEDTCFTCNQCGETFTNGNGLDVHKCNPHATGKSFPKYVFCAQCGWKFKDNKKFIIHKCCPYDPEKPFQCKKCLKGFPNASSLKYHSVKHSEERPHKCDQCTKAFKVRATLTKHRVQYHNRIDYKLSCEQCGEKFKFKSLLREHQACHDEGQNFSCDQCDKKFTMKNNLDLHKRYAHATVGPLDERSTSVSEAGVALDGVEVKEEPAVVYDSEEEQVREVKQEMDVDVKQEQEEIVTRFNLTST